MQQQHEAHLKRPKRTALPRTLETPHVLITTRCSLGIVSTRYIYDALLGEFSRVFPWAIVTVEQHGEGSVIHK